MERWWQMIDLIFLLYENYRIYFLLLLISVFAGKVGCHGFRKEYLGIKRKAVYFICLFMICCSVTYLIHRLPVGYDTVKLSVQGNATKEYNVNITSMEVSNVYYRTFKMEKGNWEKAERGYKYNSQKSELSDEISILVPYGYDRKLFFELDKNVESIIMEYAGNITKHNVAGIEMQIELPSNRARIYMGGFILQMLMAVGAGCVIPIAIRSLMRIRMPHLKLFVQEHIYGVGMLGFLLADFFCNKTEQIDIWVAPIYALNYSYGFGSRFLLGSILKMIFGEYLSSSEAYLFCEIVMVTIIAVISLLIDKLVNKINDKVKIAVIFMVLMYICSPGSITAIWTSANMGRLENYTLLLVLIAVCLFEIIQTNWIKYTVVTVISVLCIALYQGYIFLYFTVIFFIILYDFFEENDERIKKGILGIGSIIINCITFLIFQLFTYTNFSGYDEMISVLSQKTDFAMNESLKYEYFMSIKEVYEVVVEDFILSRFTTPRELLFITILLCTPIIIIFIAIWLKCIQKLTEKNKQKTFYYLWWISYIAFLPQFILNTDWGRWSIAVLFYTFFSVLYMLWKGNEEIACALESLQCLIIKNKYLMILVLIYLQRLGKFNAMSFITAANNIWQEIRVFIW